MISGHAGAHAHGVEEEQEAKGRKICSRCQGPACEPGTQSARESRLASSAEECSESKTRDTCRLSRAQAGPGRSFSRREPSWNRTLAPRRRLILTWLAVVALTVAGDLAWLASHFRGGGLRGCFPGAAAQNVSCPGNATTVPYGVGSAGLPLLRCQCRTGFFNPEHPLPVRECTPVSRCPGVRDSRACLEEAPSVAHRLRVRACMKEN